MFPQVLATVGGSGTRLYPLTLDQPKPLVELCDTAIIANLFRVLASQGCRRFILGSKGASNTLNLSNYFKAGEGFFKRLGITDHQDFSYQPLYDDQGSADSMRYCMNYYDINDDLLVVSGDNLIDIDLQSIVEFHQKHKPLLTVALKELGPEEDLSSYGVARVDEGVERHERRADRDQSLVVAEEETVRVRRVREVERRRPEPLARGRVGEVAPDELDRDAEGAGALPDGGAELAVRIEVRRDDVDARERHAPARRHPLERAEEVLGGPAGRRRGRSPGTGARSGSEKRPSARSAPRKPAPRSSPR